LFLLALSLSADVDDASSDDDDDFAHAAQHRDARDVDDRNMFIPIYSYFNISFQIGRLLFSQR
jgi:hypothetical protein